MTVTTDRETVLIVEDNESLANVFADFLAGEYDVRIALDGTEALEEIDDSIDLVVLDRRMPGLTGDEVIVSLKEQGYDCPVVLVTAVQPDFDIIETGFDNYLVKPVERDELLDIIEQTLEQTRYESLIREYYTLSSKRDRLEVIHEIDELASNEEYQSLSDRLEDVRTRIDSHLSDIERPEVTALIERTQSMAVLQESEERYRSLTDDVLDTSDVGTVIVGPSEQIEWVNASIELYFDLDRTDVLQDAYRTVVSRAFAPAVSEPSAFDERVIDAVEGNQDIIEFQCRVTGADGEKRWLKHWSKPIEVGLYSGGRIEHYYDVTPLVENQRTLDALHETTRDLIDADGETAVCNSAIEAGRSILDGDRVAVYLRDEETGRLARTRAEVVDDEDPFPDTITSGADSVLWDTYVHSEIHELSDPVDEALFDAFERVFSLPLGNHGVMVIAYQQAAAVPPSARRFAQVLASNTEVTLDRTARERALRERDDELEARNEQLNRLNRINAVIRSITQALLTATTRQEIEETVCDRLAFIEAFTFVWVGEPDRFEESIRPVTSAGDGDSFLDALQARTDWSSDEHPPAWTVADTRESIVENNLIDAAPRTAWRAEALSHGFQSVVAVPIVYDESLLAVVEIYSDTPALFTEEERSVLVELGQTIGHAINAIARRDALVADEFIELEFEIAEVDDFFSRLTSSDLGGIDIRSVIPQADGASIVFFSVDDGTEDQVTDVIDQSPAVVDHALVREDDGTKLFRCTLNESTIVTRAASHGAHPQSIQTREDAWRFTVAVPRTTEVRSFADRLVGSDDGIELVARREQSQNGSVAGPINEQIDERLTDRQREALRSAYFSGYFDWPRLANGEEIAGTMGIDQSTLQQHLRAGQRHVFEALFDRV